MYLTRSLKMRMKVKGEPEEGSKELIISVMEENTVVHLNLSQVKKLTHDHQNFDYDFK